MKATAVLAVAVGVLAQEEAPAASSSPVFQPRFQQPYTGYRGFAQPQPYTGYRGFGGVGLPQYQGGFGGFGGQRFGGYSPYRQVMASAPVVVHAEAAHAEPKMDHAEDPELAAAVTSAYASIDGQARNVKVATVDLFEELSAGTFDKFGSSFTNIGTVIGLKNAKASAEDAAAELQKAKEQPEKYDVRQAQLASDSANANHLNNWFNFRGRGGVPAQPWDLTPTLMGVIQDMNAATGAQLTLDANPNDADAQFGHEQAQNNFMATLFAYKGDMKLSQIFGLTSNSMDIPGATAEVASTQQAFAMNPTRMTEIDMEIAQLAYDGLMTSRNSQIFFKPTVAALLAFTSASNDQKINELALERANLAVSGGGNALLYNYNMRTAPIMGGYRMIGGN